MRRLGEAPVTLKKMNSSTRIAEILVAVSEAWRESNSSNLFVGLRRDETLGAEDIHQRNGDAYELMHEAAAGGEKCWRVHLDRDG